MLEFFIWAYFGVLLITILAHLPLLAFVVAGIVWSPFAFILQVLWNRSGNSLFSPKFAAFLSICMLIPWKTLCSNRGGPQGGPAVVFVPTFPMNIALVLGPISFWFLTSLYYGIAVMFWYAIQGWRFLSGAVAAKPISGVSTEDTLAVVYLSALVLIGMVFTLSSLKTILSLKGKDYSVDLSPERRASREMASSALRSEVGPYVKPFVRCSLIVVASTVLLVSSVVGMVVLPGTDAFVS